MYIIICMHMCMDFAVIIFLKYCSEVNMLSFYQFPNLSKFLIIYIYIFLNKGGYCFKTLILPKTYCFPASHV